MRRSRALSPDFKPSISSPTISSTSAVQSTCPWAIRLSVAHVVNIFRRWHGHHWSLGAGCELLGAQSILLPDCCGSLLMCWGRAASEPSPFLSCAAHSGFQADASLPPCDLSLLGSGVLLIWPRFSLYTQKPSCTLPPIVLIITSAEANRRISYLIHYLLFHSSATFTFTVALSLSLPLNTGHFYKDARLARIPFPPI